MARGTPGTPPLLLIAAGIVLMASVITSCSSSTPLPSASPPDAPTGPTDAVAAGDCIATPAEYQAAWDGQRVRCVAPTLYGTTSAADSTTLYPEGFSFAWAGTNTNLETYLELRKRYAAEPAKVGIGILSYEGFPGLADFDSPTNLEVYTLPQAVTPVVPSIEGWAGLLDEKFDTPDAFPLKAQVALDEAYSGLGRNQDAVNAFEKVTGCTRSELLVGAEISEAMGCKKDFLTAIEAAGDSPYDTGNTETCLKNFQHNYAGPRTAAAIRGVLFQCFDVGFLNTGVALGYNTYANPMVCKPAAEQSVEQRVTGQEVIVPNTAIDSLPEHVAIPLDIGAPRDRAFLQKGYC